MPSVAASATPTLLVQEATPTTTQSLVVLVSSPGADAILTEDLSLTLSELASTEGLDFELRSSVTQGESLAEIRLLAAIPPDPGLAELAQSAPETQFLGIDLPNLEPSDNLTLIIGQEASPDMIGFMAGYLAAVVTPEWRVGMISVSDSSQGLSQRDGFINGAVFFCGLCRQTYPPYLAYPLFAEAPANSSPGEWLVLADTLIDSAVQSAYIPPGVGDESLLEYLAQAGVNLISTTHPPAGLEEYWIASLTSDIPSTIHDIWTELMAGQGGSVLTAGITVSYANPDLYSPGRQRLVEGTMADLSAGFIDTGVQTGSQPQ